jgi:hypothetical protein
MKPRRIELHIDELVLHGFAPADRHLIGDAVAMELTRLLTEQGFPATAVSNPDRAHVDAGQFEVAPNARPQNVGSQVAHVLFGGVTR